MGKNEGEIEDYLKARIKELGGMSLKWVSPGFKGVPDQIVLLPNACIDFVEVKAPGEEPSKLQLWVHRQLRRLGFKVHVIDTKNQVDEIYPT